MEQTIRNNTFKENNLLSRKKLTLLVSKYGIIGTTRILKKKDEKICYSAVYDTVIKLNIPHLSQKEAVKKFKRKARRTTTDILNVVDELVRRK